MLTSFFFHRHLDDEEELVTVVHRHWIMGCKTLWLPTLAFGATWLLLMLGVNRYMLAIVGIAEACITVWWLRNFFDYYLDAWIITDQGIIDISWHGWFHRESSRVLYSDIQGVSYEIRGVLGTLMRFGTVSVEKISAGTEISLTEVKHPRRVENILLQCMEKYMHKKNLKDATTVQEILSEFVASSMHLRGKGVPEKEERTSSASPKKGTKKKEKTVSGTRRW